MADVLGQACSWSGKPFCRPLLLGLSGLPSSIAHASPSLALPSSILHARFTPASPQTRPPPQLGPHPVPHAPASQGAGQRRCAGPGRRAPRLCGACFTSVNVLSGAVLWGNRCTCTCLLAACNGCDGGGRHQEWQHAALASHPCAMRTACLNRP